MHIFNSTVGILARHSLLRDLFKPPSLCQNILYLGFNLGDCLGSADCFRIWFLKSCSKAMMSSGTSIPPSVEPNFVSTGILASVQHALI
jgi:hypothetical protein